MNRHWIYCALVPCCLVFSATACTNNPEMAPPSDVELVDPSNSQLHDETPRAVEVQDLPYEALDNNRSEQDMPTAAVQEYAGPGSSEGLITTNDCMVFSEKVKEPPFFSPELGVVFTRAAKMCLSEDGRKGFVPDSPWLAMGIPCTGGGGRVSWNGTQNVPKAIHFTMANGCPMAPLGINELTKKMQQLSFPASMKVIGYSPLAISYWQLPDFPDHDTGEVLDFVSQVGIERGWKQFLENLPIRVRLIGRENAFVRSEFLYEVLGSIRHSGRRAFIFEVSGVSVLSSEDREKFRRSCANLGQSRNCQEIFGSHLSDEY